ncbi:MAG: hypothetical protein Q8S84_04965 [bacterium]|nr:hypothetical protein [bacterium]
MVYFSNPSPRTSGYPKSTSFGAPPLKREEISPFFKGSNAGGRIKTIVHNSLTFCHYKNSPPLLRMVNFYNCQFIGIFQFFTNISLVSLKQLLHRNHLCAEKGEG